MHILDAIDKTTWFHPSKEAVSILRINCETQNSIYLCIYHLLMTSLTVNDMGMSVEYHLSSLGSCTILMYKTGILWLCPVCVVSHAHTQIILKNAMLGVYFRRMYESVSFTVNVLEYCDLSGKDGYFMNSAQHLAFNSFDQY